MSFKKGLSIGFGGKNTIIVELLGCIFRRKDGRALCVAERVPERLRHREEHIGDLMPGDQIVWVGVTSAHRGQSFQACEFLMDYLKTQAPFWKKETGPNGSHWVDARISDDQALARWGIQTKNALP